jgi:DNA primase catalytic core
MARLPDEVVERIKREISVQRLAEARGIKLRRSGKELIGLCPFHKDINPSLNIDPVKNVWQCKGACGKSGSVIDWVMLAEGVSVRHALELLCRDYLPSAANATEPPPRKSTTVKLPPLVEHTADDRQLLERVVSHYHEALKNSPAAQQYLVKRGLQSAEMVEQFRLGFADRSLGYRVPASNRAAGIEQRGRLQQLGILRKNGREHLRGSVVIPIFNLEGKVMQMYGRKIAPRHLLREDTSEHLYLPGPHRGVWNEPALIASKEIILCEALIDALTFWCAGYRHVTTSYGVNGFTEEIKTAFQKHGTKRIYIAYDRDDAGENAARKHAEELIEMGIECFRVQFIRGQDANEFALKNQPAAKFLGMYLSSAAWLGKSKRPTVAVIEPRKIEPQPSAVIEEDTIKPAAKEKISEAATTPTEEQIPEPVSAAEETTAAKEKISAEESISATPLPSPISEEPVSSLAAQLPIAPLPTGTVVPVREARVEVCGDTVYVTRGERRYRILDLAKNTAPGVLQVNVMVTSTSTRGETHLHVDRFDLYGARPRSLFAKQAAKELGHKEESIERDLSTLILKLEDLQREWIEKTLTPQEEKSEMTTEEKSAALELLRDPRLLERVLADFAQCGVVGEETNKKVAYLGAVSRLLNKPLAIVAQSSSSAGKSSLMEAVLDFMPEDQRESYTAMTGQSLFYMGEKNLKHKILAIAEQQGAERAAYPLKLLQSEGRLKIASTGKDPASGKHVTHDYTVEGPVMIFLTTTAQDVDEELLNRAIVLTVNEEPEQTRAIHQKQREAQTIEGMWAHDDRAEIVKLHHNLQRLLRPLRVVNEHVQHQAFPDAMIRTRRDHQKFLTLVQAIALLHQHQREIKTSTRKGKTLEYIEATEADIKLALHLVNEVLTPSLEELQAQTRRLLLLIDTMVTGECARLQIERSEYRFTRATVRQYTRWGDTQLRVHLRRLEELEYLIVRHGAPGQTFVYQLNFEMDAEGRPVLARLSQFYSYDTNYAGVNRDCAGGARPGSGGVARGARGEESPVLARRDGNFSPNHKNNSTRGMEAGSGAGNRIVALPPVADKPNGGLAAGVK